MSLQIQSVKISFLPILVFSLLSLVVFSCVSPKKYKAKVAEVERKEQENERIKRQFYEAQKLLLLSSDSLKEVIFSLQTKDYQLDSLQKVAKKTVDKNNVLNKELQEKEQQLTQKETEILSKEKNISVLRNKQYQRQRQSNELQKSIKTAFSSLNKESFSVNSSV